MAEGKSGYRHTQVGWVIIGSLVLAALILLPTLIAAELTNVLLVMLAVLGITLALFATMTVSVDGEALRFHMGVGLIRKSIPLSDVRHFRVTRTPWYFGWGIRIFPGGMLYNVSGLESVELLLKNGSRIRVGSDEPEAVQAALVDAMGEPEPLTEEEAAQVRRGTRVALVVLGAIVLLSFAGVGSCLYLEQKPPKIAVDDRALEVDGLVYDAEVPLEEITRVELVTSHPRIIARTNGFAWGATLRGWFKLEQMGEGQLFIEDGKPPYVLVRKRDSFVYLNLEEPGKTRAVFDRIRRQLPQ